MNRPIVSVIFLFVMLFLIPTSILADINQPHYNVKAQLDPVQKSAEGTVSVVWQNDSGFDLDYLELGLWFNALDHNKITSLKINGIERDLEEFSRLDSDDHYYKAFYRITDEKPFLKNKEVVLEYNFETENVSSSYEFIHYTGNWFPTLYPVFDGAPTFKRDQWAIYDVEVNYPTGWDYCSTGLESNKTEEDSTTTISLHAEEVTNFAVLLFQDFKHLEAEVKGVKIHSWYREGDDWCGEFLLEKAKDVMKFYVDEFGYYPQPHINILPGAEKPYGGYPLAANCVVVHRGLDESRADFTHWILSHEIGHEYWGFGNVLEEQTGCRWFGISMGIYTDWIYSKSVGISPSRHQGFENRYVNGVFAEYDTRITQTIPELDNQEGLDWNNVIKHGKSFAVLKILNDFIGEKTFRIIHQHFLDNYRGKTVDYNIFKDVSEEISGQDLDWFFAQWYDSNAVLDYRIVETKRWQEKGIWITEVVIENFSDLIMPIEVGLKIGTDEYITKSIGGWQTRETVRFESEMELLEIKLDPHKRLPVLIHYLNDYDFLVSAGSGLVNDGHLEKGREFLNRAMGLGEVIIPRHYYFMAKERMFRGDYKSAFRILDKLFTLTEGESLDFYTGYGNIIYGKVYDLMGNREKAIEYYNVAKEIDESKESAEKLIEKPYEIK
jgi:tetratricopeptide (TPR) repeat protein